MATHQLSEHFAQFFKVINPSPTWVSNASSQYNTIKGVIENAGGDAGILKPKIFLQGSYGRETAIYTINDLDLVALCSLWYPPSSGDASRGWGREAIFKAIAEPLLNDGRYASKVAYGPTSMCIKLDLGIEVEILPVVFKSGNSDPNVEPFYLYRPERARWEEGFAKHHQACLTAKNKQTDGNFIPMVKVLKHIRTRCGSNAVSFHLECLLYCLSNVAFVGSPADYVTSVVSLISSHAAPLWKTFNITTPSGERNLFCDTEWREYDWTAFHVLITQVEPWLIEAVNTGNRNRAIECWQKILGPEYFPAY